MANQQKHANNLKTARRSLTAARNPALAAKEAAKTAISMAKLTAYIDPMLDWLFAIALALAILKDIFDIINTALIAAGGLGAVLIFLFTTMVSLMIGLIMILTGVSGKVKIAKTLTKRIILLLSVTIIEYIPGVDLLPLESLVVIIIFWMTLVERKMNADKEKESEREVAQNTPYYQKQPA